MARHTRNEDLSTLQTTLLYAGMRLYRAGPTASEILDRVSLRLMQVYSIFPPCSQATARLTDSPDNISACPQQKPPLHHAAHQPQPRRLGKLDPRGEYTQVSQAAHTVGGALHQRNNPGGAPQTCSN